MSIFIKATKYKLWEIFIDSLFNQIQKNFKSFDKNKELKLEDLCSGKKICIYEKHFNGEFQFLTIDTINMMSIHNNGNYTIRFVKFNTVIGGPANHIYKYFKFYEA